MKLNEKLEGHCDSELCWSQLSSYPDSLRMELQTYFRPVMPKKWLSNHREWLNTYDIENVLNQYEKKHTNYKSFGAVPIDFDSKLSSNTCVVDELCNLQVESLLNNGITQFSVVFNLDRHDEPGSHWIAMYVNLTVGDIIYFDSYGYDSPSEVCTLMKRIKEQLIALNSRANIRVSKLRHQYKNSECGMYCLYFIINLLEGKTFSQLTKKPVPDDSVERKRDVYFVKYNNTMYLK